jgi:hypothetical protein
VRNPHQVKEGSQGEKSKVVFMAFLNEVEKKRLNQTSLLRG